MSEQLSHLQRLNPEQYNAVTHTEGPLLILAGAGSGKTRVLTRRIAHLLHLGVEPEHLLAVTFTNKAASEMKERVAELVGEVGRKVWVSTFHASCCRILRAEAEALGFTKRFAIYDDDDQLRLLKQIVLDLGYDPKIVVAKQVLGRIDHYKNRMMGVEELVAQKRGHGNEPLVRVWRAYDEALTASDAMDFNDLIGMAVKLFAEHPGVLAKYREKFRYVMVDEYQDTNRAQYQLLQLLTREHRNLAVVGDDDQSIYGFRGADISNILNFETDFPDATVVRMEQNYRCTENILAVANAVVEKNEDRIAKRLWTDRQGGAKVQFLVSPDPHAEARTVAKACLELRRRGTEYGEIAVIYRTNATSQPFELAFREIRIPYKVVGGRQFYSRREVRDVLCYVRLVMNPADDAAFLRVCNVPTRGVGTTTIKLLRDEAVARGEPLLKVARSLGKGSSRAAKPLGAFVQLIDGLVESAQSASLPAFVQQVLERSGYVRMLTEEDTHEAKGRLENLQQLLRDAASYEPNAEEPGVSPVQGWLDRTSLTGSDEELPEGGEVTLMTVHNSKGLEYPVVFVVNMVEGQFPHSRSAEEPGGVDEERRLAYVAFTRAQKRLFVSRSLRELTWDGGASKTLAEKVAASRFLFGIPVEACDGAPTLDEEAAAEEPGRASGPGRAQTKVEAAKFAAFMAHHRPRQVKDEPRAAPPSSAYTTLEIESPEQLNRGVRVLHDRYGVGEVILRAGATLQVRFDRGITRIGLTDGGLHLLRD
jgi:DNA helicase-2/ATP-dependent DNA helicase PcrA